MEKSNECLYCISLDTDEKFDKWKLLMDIGGGKPQKSQIECKNESITMSISVPVNATLAISSGNELTLVLGNEDIVVTKKINYCPMCGKKLKEE